jgi:hypothetical protein
MQVSQLHMQIRICVRIVGLVITHIATDADFKSKRRILHNKKANWLRQFA